MSDHEAAWPVDIRVAPDRKSLTVSFTDGRSYRIEAELLRVRSPSAEVQGHSPGQRVTVGGKVDVTITKVLPVGNYAVRLAFDDGHDTGIFSWKFLSELGAAKDERWAEYLAELADKNMSRTH
ncbi:DUF971 domain-containing protein [Hoeflea sp. YIM 152468]|uniref:DUF971 domain-containing protein n=1 Tax=Hoeflea sp. YIM 152468 TaxID=3031759 RepID=UPI0023DA2201|nr:DUF971 domain-containing protein [Hoeflea sp. YIM 152468]MDF1607360.1 DUF971 domain-containing protein [Hoeflea sp. YIM 152468]